MKEGRAAGTPMQRVPSLLGADSRVGHSHGGVRPGIGVPRRRIAFVVEAIPIMTAVRIDGRLYGEVQLRPYQGLRQRLSLRMTCVEMCFAALDTRHGFQSSDTRNGEIYYA